MARSGSPARASASASAIFNSPSNNRTFCSRSSSTPRRMSSSPSPSAPLCSGRPALEKHAERAPHGQIMLAREAGEFECVRRGARVVATHQFEQGRVHSSIRERADMGEVRDPRLHARR